ncbi:polynucleotide phosphorylase [Parcubacteria bacterium DG_74_3]|nr:MAG: polynucleotide phosphorylase [Parcubacteria bacterium DG_74_3]
MKEQKFQIEIGKRNLKVEIKNLAEQASGSCLVRYGDTVVLATVVMSDIEKEEVDFLPLTVDYEERYYAAGKILGSRYIRRESRPSDEAILTSRLIDRAIRPRFPKHLKRETQVVVTCLSWDRENDPDMIGLIASSIAILISNIPWSGPIAPLRIGRINGEFLLNPTYPEREKGDLELAISGVQKNGDILINMIEAEGQEISESEVLDAVNHAKPHLIKLINFQEQIAKKVGKEKIRLPEPPSNPELENEIKKFLGERLEKALFQQTKENRAMETKDLEEELLAFVEEKYLDSPVSKEKSLYAKDFFQKEIERVIHQNIILKEKRPDGRKMEEIREIYCEAGLLPRTHGSGLFCRGQTKALSILTLGAPGDVRLLEGMEIIGKKRFMHHYNFPPYSVGEVKPIRGPGRREIGHGMLVERALLPVIPSLDQFPYTMRIVSEILSSNGSTSMASASSSSLALMDAGVPIKAPVAGIALGLMVEEDNYKILTDIQGPEDHYGDMDLKVAGTEKGITAIQMDVKVQGIPEKTLQEGLVRAKKARFQILAEMKKVLPGSRSKLSPFAPRILTLQINPDKIREVIGPGGKVINEITEECGVSIDIEDTGKIFVTSDSEEAAKKAISWIKNITREVKVGEVFQGKVKRILSFGAMVEIFPGQEGLIHISQLAPWRVKKVEDVVNVGDVVQVKVVSIDEQGRVNLSLKEAKTKYARKKQR